MLSIVKSMLIGLILLFGLAKTSLAEKPQIDVVFILSLSCPYCMSTEPLLGQIEAELQKVDGRLIQAALDPVSKNISKEIGFYAARKMGPTELNAYKALVYDAVINKNLPLSDFGQLFALLETSQDQLPFKLDDLAKLISEEESEFRGSHLRAMRLAFVAGSNLLPSFILLNNGEVDSVHERSATNATVSLVVKSLTNRIKELHKENLASKDTEE